MAHLQDSDKKQRVYSEKARRNCDAHDFPCTFSGVAEVVGVGECLYVTVQSDRSLDREIGQNPVTSCKRTTLPHEAVDKTPDSHILPRHVEMIKSEIVVVLQQCNVKPIVKNHSNPAQLQQTDGLQRHPIFWPTNNQVYGRLEWKCNCNEQIRAS